MVAPAAAIDRCSAFLTKRLPVAFIVSPHGRSLIIVVVMARCAAEINNGCSKNQKGFAGEVGVAG
ncbi:MAG TPA: hypothetical protein VNR18_13285 [Hyphomicrobiales bacterium]|nr:hypothetical protein [Hyphomicrobiales bacterium]